MATHWNSNGCPVFEPHFFVKWSPNILGEWNPIEGGGKRGQNIGAYQPLG